MVELPACFFMICTNKTERECLDLNLFGDRQSRITLLRTIKKGDIGFLLNVSTDQLLGVFIAESSVQEDIVPDAWQGQFKAQIKVRLLNDLQRIDSASTKLESIISLNTVNRSPYSYKTPSKRTYGPEITGRVLTLFNNGIQLVSQESQPQNYAIQPDVTLADIAGLSDVKEFISKRIIAPFEDEDRASSLGLRIGGGMLLFGPPGTGKTLIAKSIARDIQGKFFEISPSIIVGYPGEAEKRLEGIFAALNKEPRAVIFVDEAEWILSKREDQVSSVMQRVTPTLLVQLTHLFEQKTRAVIVIAATNKPELIDTAFLRPGRFDKIFYVGLPNLKAREEIIKLQVRNRANCLAGSDFHEIARALDGYSGADIEHIIEESAFIAFNDRTRDPALISKSDILDVISRTPKSVRVDDLKRLEKWASERGILIESSP